jgi:hypothetical protein
LRIQDVVSRIPNPTIFSSRVPDPDPNIFSYRILHEKWNANILLLASYASRSKVLVLVIVKKIWDPRSRIWKKFITDPDPGSMG